MAIAAPIIPAVSANAHSWLHRAIAHFLPAPAAVAVTCPIETAIVDLRLILRRIDHAQREHSRWDACYLAQTVAHAVIDPLEALDLPSGVGRLRHGAVFALAPIAGIETANGRGHVDVTGDLEEAAALVRAAIADAEALRKA